MARHSQVDAGWIKRRFAKIEKQLRESGAAKNLQAATIGNGGLTLKAPGRFRGIYQSGRTAFEFGPLGDNAFGMSVRPDADDTAEVSTALLEVYRIAPTAEDPAGANVVRSVGGDVFVARGTQAFVVGAGPLGQDSVAQVLGGDFGLTLSCTTGPINIDAATGTRVSHSTTGASANTFIDPSDGRIWRSTSSRRYKQDIEDAEVDPDAVLKMQPRTWRDKAEVEAKPETERRYVGFIAEELDELGLDEFVVYDSDGAPEAIAYDRLTAALIGVVQRQEERLAALEARLGEEP